MAMFCNCPPGPHAISVTCPAHGHLAPDWPPGSSVVLAPTDLVDSLEPYVNAVLQRLSGYLDMPQCVGAFVTDRSHFSDFMHRAQRPIDYDALSVAIGVPISRDDPSIVSAAQKLYQLSLGTLAEHDLLSQALAWRERLAERMYEVSYGGQKFRNMDDLRQHLAAHLLKVVDCDGKPVPFP